MIVATITTMMMKNMRVKVITDAAKKDVTAKMKAAAMMNHVTVHMNLTDTTMLLLPAVKVKAAAIQKRKERPRNLLPAAMLLVLAVLRKRNPRNPAVILPALAVLNQRQKAKNQDVAPQKNLAAAQRQEENANVEITANAGIIVLVEILRHVAETLRRKQKRKNQDVVPQRNPATAQRQEENVNVEIIANAGIIALVEIVRHVVPIKNRKKQNAVLLNVQHAIFLSKIFSFKTINK